MWLDGNPASTLPLPDRGLDFGDGLFETLLLCNGTPLYLEFHLQRLQRGLDVLGIPDCLREAGRQLEAAADDIGNRHWDWAALRLTVARAPGPRGYAPGEPGPPRILITASCLERDCSRLSNAAALAQSSIRLAAQPALAGIKHLNRLEQVLAADEVRRAGADEGLMLDSSGGVACVVAGNLFMVRDGVLCTPLLRDCGIAGTRRRLVMERWAPALDIPVSEVPLTSEDLEDAQEVFYTNSLVTLCPVASVAGKHWTNHPVCEALFNRFREELPC